jgi:hypothetical protein
LGAVLVEVLACLEVREILLGLGLLGWGLLGLLGQKKKKKKEEALLPLMQQLLFLSALLLLAVMPRHAVASFCAFLPFFCPVVF